jgi:hypothetical protein
MRTLCSAALLGFGAVAAAQDAAVPGHVGAGASAAEVRLEIERVEDAVYARFNAINSSDDLDVLCVEQTPTGTDVPVRTCAPRFMTAVEARAGANTQDSATENPTEQALSLREKNRRLMAEMQRLAREDQELQRGLTRLAELRQLQQPEQPEEERRSGRSRRAER